VPRRSAHLLIIDRDEEHVAISEMSKSGDIWIGRMQHDYDDEYRNINYIEWDLEYYGNGEPNDYGDDCSGLFCDGGGHPGGGDERCIEYKTETGLWNDEKCYRADRVICEWDNVAPATGARAPRLLAHHLYATFIVAVSGIPGV
jgi:hypothetical protein